MSAEPTQDPDVMITQRVKDVVTYRNADGEVWWIKGVCSGCGVCDGNGPHAGPPEGRLDIPVRPEGPPTWPSCTLTGAYYR